MSSIIDGKARRFGSALLAMVLAGCARTPLAKDPPQPQKEAEPAEPAEPAGPTEPAEPASPCKRAADARARVPDLLSAGWLDRSRRLLDWADRSCPKEAATSRALRERVTSELTDARSTSELIKAARAAEAAHNPAEMRRLYDRAMTRAEADAGERIALDVRDADSYPAASKSPDGRFFAVAERQVVSVRASTTELGPGFVETHRIGPWGGDVASLAFSPDGKTLAVAIHDETIRWIDTTTFREVKTLVHPKRPILGLDNSNELADVLDQVAFSPDGRWFASRRVSGGPNGGSALIWDAKSGARVQLIDTVNGGTDLFTFSKDGNSLWNATYVSGLEEWDVATGAIRRRHSKSDDHGNLQPIYSERQDELTDPRTPTELSFDVETIYRTALSPTRNHALSVSMSAVLLWTFGASSNLRPVVSNPGRRRWLETSGIQFAWTHDGSRFAVSIMGVTEVWDTEGRKLALAEGTAKHLSFSPDGNFLEITQDNGVKLLPLEGKPTLALTAQARVEEQRFPNPTPEIFGINDASRRPDGEHVKIGLLASSAGNAGIATTPDGSAVEVFGPDGDSAQQVLRCRLGTRAFPFEFCRGRFERPGLVLDALSYEGEVSP